MRALGEGSLAGVLMRGLDVFRILLFLLGCAVCLLAIGAVIGYATGSENIAPGVRVARVDPWYVIALAFALWLGWLAAALIVVDRLRSIFATLSHGDPFVPENAGHLRVIWVAVAVFELLRYGVSALQALALHLAGDAATGMQSNMQFTISAWLAVLVLIVLAEVFREGARLRQEQKLTI